MDVQKGSVARGNLPSGSTVVLTGRPDLLVPTLATRLLAQGHRVLVPTPLLPSLTTLRTWARGGPTAGDHRAPEFVEHEPEDPDVPAELADGVDLVLHLDAGPVGENLRGRSTATLDALFALRVAESNGARLVLASSGEQDWPGTVEGLVAGFRSAHAVDAVLVRVPECYGPGLPPGGTGVVARMLAQATATGTVVVDRRDRRRHRPCFVEDVVTVLLGMAADGGAEDGTPVRIGPAVSMGTAEVAEQVCRAAGATMRVVGLGALDDPVALEGDEAAAAPLAGGPGLVGLAEGLRRCLEATNGPRAPGAVAATVAPGTVVAPAVPVTSTASPSIA